MFVVPLEIKIMYTFGWKVWLFVKLSNFMLTNKLLQHTTDIDNRLF